MGVYNIAETYSYTLDEALALGVPALVGNLGAPAERIKESGAGWVLDDISFDAVRVKLEEIVLNKEDYIKTITRIIDCGIISTSQEASNYSELYAEIIDLKDLSLAVKIENLQEVLNSLSILKLPEASLAVKILAKISNKIIYILDLYGLRTNFQKMLFRVLPKAWLYRIRDARV